MTRALERDHQIVSAIRPSAVRRYVF
jgi:hypothetical protein